MMRIRGFRIDFYKQFWSWLVTHSYGFYLVLFHTCYLIFVHVRYLLRTYLFLNLYHFENLGDIPDLRSTKQSRYNIKIFYVKHFSECDYTPWIIIRHEVDVDVMNAVDTG